MFVDVVVVVVVVVVAFFFVASLHFCCMCLELSVADSRPTRPQL
jgi:hypothetical protein